MCLWKFVKMFEIFNIPHSLFPKVKLYINSEQLLN
jgi:hypothetical protein